jgi:hypothetical protein
MVDKKHLKRRRMVMDVEPTTNRTRNSIFYIDTPFDLNTLGPVPVPDSSGDEYEGESEDEREVEVDAELPSGPASEDENSWQIQEMERAGNKKRRRGDNQTRSYYTRSAAEPESNFESLSDGSYVSDRQSLRPSERPKREKRLRTGPLIEESDSEGLDEIPTEPEDNIPPIIAPTHQRVAVESWFTTSGLDGYRYFPQIKDLVVYSRTGHKQHSDRSQDYPILVDETLPDIILGRVLQIKTTIIQTFVVVNIKMAIYPTMEPVQISESNLSKISIEMLYEADKADFLFLWSDFDRSKTERWMIGDQCKLRTEKGLICATVSEIREQQDPWQKLALTLEDGEIRLASSWEICKPELDFRPIEYIDESEKQRLASILDSVIAQEDLTPFVVPINFDEFPSYLSIVAYPICVSLIRSRLENNYYRRTEQVVWEWELMCKNVNAFNKRSSYICKLCRASITPLKIELQGKQL